jgi:hypothetical protein
MMHFMVLRNYNLWMLFPLIADVGVCGVPIQIADVGVCGVPIQIADVGVCGVTIQISEVMFH